MSRLKLRTSAWLPFTLLAACLSCHAENKDFSGLDLKEKKYIDADLRRAIFDCADARSVNFKHATLEKASLIGAKLQNANFRQADLSGANFTDAHLEGATLTDAKAWDATFRNCVIFLARAETHDWDAIPEVRNVPGVAELLRANEDPSSGSLSFRRADMRDCVIYGNAEGVDFLKADLRGADLGHVLNLDKAVLRGARYDEETRWSINPEKMGAVFENSDRPPSPPPHPLAGKWLILKGIDDAKDHGVLHVWRDGIFQWDTELSKENPKMFSGEWKPIGDKKEVIELKIDATGEVWSAKLTFNKGKPEIQLTSAKGLKQVGVGD